MKNLTIIIPFYNGHSVIDNLLSDLKQHVPNVPVIVVDDLSNPPFKPRDGIETYRMTRKGWFAGAVNAGIRACQTDVLVLNQDIRLSGINAFKLIAEKRSQYAIIGERIAGEHPAWPKGYIHGTFMFMRRDAINDIGYLDFVDYPLWGNTCEWQLRASRAGYKVLPVAKIPNMVHERTGNFGDSIKSVLNTANADTKSKLIRTPPMISVIVSCYNYGRYLPDLIASLIGGDSSLGKRKPQTFQSFEVVIVDDGSIDNSFEIAKKLADPYKGIRAIRHSKNMGTAAANNTGIDAANGKYVTFICADDMMESGRLERMYRTLLRFDDNHFIYDGIMPFAEGMRRPDIPVGAGHYITTDLRNRNRVHCGIMTSKKNIIHVGKYPPQFNDGREDWAIAIALNRAGICGIYDEGYKGYLYRREKQNRTLTNTNPAKHNIFLGKMKSVFPNMYEGDLPIMCCGSSRTVKGVSTISKKVSAALPKISGGDNVILEYIGGNVGTSSFYGVVSNGRYRAGDNLTSKFISADRRDLQTGIARKPGLLEMRGKDGKPLFRIHKPQENAKVEKARKPVAAKAKPVAVNKDVKQQNPEPEQPEVKAIMNAVSKLILPDITEMSIAAVKSLDLSPEIAEKLLPVEKAGKNRKTLIAYLEEKASK